MGNSRHPSSDLVTRQHGSARFHDSDVENASCGIAGSMAMPHSNYREAEGRYSPKDHGDVQARLEETRHGSASGASQNAWLTAVAPHNAARVGRESNLNIRKRNGLGNSYTLIIAPLLCAFTLYSTRDIIRGRPVLATPGPSRSKLFLPPFRHVPLLGVRKLSDLASQWKARWLASTAYWRN